MSSRPSSTRSVRSTQYASSSSRPSSSRTPRPPNSKVEARPQDVEDDVVYGGPDELEEDYRIQGLVDSFRNGLDTEIETAQYYDPPSSSTSVIADDPITPSHALFDALSDVDSGTAVRLLKAQLRATESELDTAIANAKQAQQQVSVLKSETKQLSQDNGKIDKAVKTTQAQLDQYRNTAETATRNLQAAEASNKSLVKELDAMKRTHKQHEAKLGTMQVRLNRAHEELETEKRQKNRSGKSSADTNDEMRKQVDALKSQNSLLLAQRKELLDAFKKQLQLIDVLKRQKLHVEAARVLQFSEEEFVKALDWGSE